MMCYSYIAGIGSLNASVPLEGSYREMIECEASDIIGEEEKEDFLHFCQSDTLKENLDAGDSAAFECHVSRQGKEDWEHLIAVCLEYYMSART